MPNAAREAKQRYRARRSPRRDAAPSGHGSPARDPRPDGLARPHGRRAPARPRRAAVVFDPTVDFEFSDRCKQLRERLLAFMVEHVYPAEEVYEEQLRASGDPHSHPPVMEELKARAQELGLWNLFLPHSNEAYGAPGLSNADYAPLAEIMGRSYIASEACNCAAPDTGNMEVLTLFGTPEQKEQWLRPLLAGEIRSAFAMTEPAVASSDATNIELRIERDGDEYVLNGRKWWISGALRERCKIFIVMGKTGSGASESSPFRQQSMILVPRDTPGVTIIRNLPVFGYIAPEGHAEMTFEDVRVPASNLISEEGHGFLIAQARLGPGRIHHCMRTIGAAERALELMCARAASRVTFGAPVADRANVQDWIAESRIEIDMARLLTLKAAWLMDTAGNKQARTEIAAIKVAAPNVALRVLDRAIQVHGGGGVSDDFPLASMYAHIRTLRLADGPDEVHKRSIARRELRRVSAPEVVVG
jgi:acyl-CoA dehydrogenase